MIGRNWIIIIKSDKNVVSASEPKIILEILKLKLGN